jgi:hypothetical protein
MLVIDNEYDEKELFKKLFSHDEQTVRSFYSVKDDKAYKALKVPTIDKMNAALKGKLSVFTHSNRLIEPRIESTTLASYSRLGDVNAFTENLESLVDLSGNAANSPAYQVMLTSYLLNGVETNLLEALKTGREVCSLFNTPLPKTSFSFDNYDKRVFIPYNDSYVVALPRTPAWKTIGILNAQKALFEQEILASKPKLGEKEKFVLSTKLRVSEILQGQNASYLTGKVTRSQVHHSVFLPPSKNQSAVRRVLKMIEKNGISEKALLVLLKDVVADSGIVYELAKQMHQVYADDDIRGKYAPDNVFTRMAFANLGRKAYSAMSEIIEYENEEEKTFSTFFESKLDDLAELAWVRAYYKLPNKYVFDGAKKSFMEGFHSKTTDSADEESPETEYQTTRVAQETSKAYEGSYLRIIMNVDGYDAGSNGFSLGPVQPVAINGWLHNLLERNSGIKYKCFTPVYESIHLHDQACLKASDITLISHKTFSENADEISKSIETGADFNKSWIYTVGEKSMTTRSGTGDRCGFGDAANYNPSMRMDVQASAEMSVIVELNHALSNSEANDLIATVSREIRRTKLGGGVISVKHVGVYVSEPKTKGFALKRKEVANLKDWLKHLSFINRDYIGDVPIGLLAVGYDSVSSAPDIIHKGETYSSHIVETIYKGFSFVKSSNKDKAWFYPNVDLSTNNFYFSLIK